MFNENFLNDKTIKFQIKKFCNFENIRELLLARAMATSVIVDEKLVNDFEENEKYEENVVNFLNVVI